MEVWQIWVIISLALVILEIFTPGFVVICFSFGGAGAAIASACGLALVWQISIFALVSALIFFFVRPLVTRLFFRRKKETLTNIDAIIGRIAIVSEEIDPKTNTGRVKLDGDDWKAESEDGNPHESGERVCIVSRDGITVKVKGLEADN